MNIYIFLPFNIGTLSLFSFKKIYEIKQGFYKFYKISVFDYVCFKIMKRKVEVIRQNVLLHYMDKTRQYLSKDIKKPTYTEKTQRSDHPLPPQQ